MQAEPIGYIYEYEIGALAVFLVIMLRYFSARRFPNQKNRFYALILWTTVADIILDVVSSIIIDHVFLVPLSVTYAVNMAFYAMTVLMLVLMMLYTITLTGYISKKRLLRICPLLLPGAIILLLLLSNPFTNWFFYVDPARGYVRGAVFGLSYVVCFIYLLFTVVVVLQNRARLRREEFSTILLFLAVVLITTLIQYLWPPLLITGVAIAFSVVLMYFTIQNPESMMDATTGSFTYEAMLSFLQDRLEENDRVQLVAIKIHNMSRINELLGIENGSLLLRQVSRFLREGTQDSWVFRMRGSCLVAITRTQTDYALLCAQFHQRVGQPWFVNGTEVLLQATVCCIDAEALLSGPISPSEAIRYLETAFTESGHAGKRIMTVVAGTALLEKVKRNAAVEAALRVALAGGEGLELYFQPLWSIAQKRFVSAEVLLRFRHPDMGFIPPEEFVAIAENNGLVTVMDELVVRKACAFLQEHANLQSLGLEKLDINLSALEFMRRRLPQLLRNIMAQHQTDPTLLCFEVTETAATESFALLKECMLDIQHYGCSFALDDFGTGYANISQVIQLPFSVVKLDKSLLTGPASVLEDLVRMFARIDRQTVIEGVETAEQAARMQSCGVDIIQGYYYARPMCEADFVAFLQDANQNPAMCYRR